MKILGLCQKFCVCHNNVIEKIKVSFKYDKTNSTTIFVVSYFAPSREKENWGQATFDEEEEKEKD